MIWLVQVDLLPSVSHGQGIGFRFIRLTLFSSFLSFLSMRPIGLNVLFVTLGTVHRDRVLLITQSLFLKPLSPLLPVFIVFGFPDRESDF